jgi:non-homologous end joining protein Ku
MVLVLEQIDSPRDHVIDLMKALKESMKTVQRGKKWADQRKRRKA